MISIILPTNRLNNKETIDTINSYRTHILNLKEFPTEEFRDLVDMSTKDIQHFIQITLNSLQNQTDKDFEVLLCHKYPDDVSNIIKSYDINIRLIKEKGSIWHSLGDQYRTVNNIRNTGIMNSKGDLLLFLDDFTFFNNDIISNIKQNFSNGCTTTFRSMRRIRYRTSEDKVESTKNKVRFFFGDMTSGFNFLDKSFGDNIPVSCTWTYGCTVSKKDCLDINGFDEIYDGVFGGTDVDFGKRLEKNGSNNLRVLGKNIIYEFHHPTSRKYFNKNGLNTDMFRSITKQYPDPFIVKANTWKPTKSQLSRYEYWYIRKYGKMEDNWNNFMNVPLYNLRECTI
jgi:hypothetical protein